MMTTPQMLVLAALSRERMATILRCLGAEPCRGRPWSASRRRRVLLTCAALRTNLTIRELAATFGVSRSAADRIIASMTPRIAALLPCPAVSDRRDSWGRRRYVRADP
jgi:DNA-binding MarR family transcriptional regulator